MSAILSKILISAGTPILTKDLGYVPIEQIYKQECLVWTGNDWALTQSNRYDEEVNIYNVNFNQRYHLRVSEQFNWLVLDDDDNLVSKSTLDLRFADYITPFKIFSKGGITTQSNIRVCSITNLKKKERLYHLDYTNSDRFVMNGVLTGIV